MKQHRPHLGKSFQKRFCVVENCVDEQGECTMQNVRVQRMVLLRLKLSPVRRFPSVSSQIEAGGSRDHVLWIHQSAPV